MLLGDLGADVIKVEQPGTGDDTRQWGPPHAGGEAAYYLSINRNKRSLALDLKQPANRETIRRLAARSDVFVENFRRGTTAAWGLDYATLREANPRLVYCTISGYGPVGPLAAHPGYDFVLQAGAGLMSITGEADGPPMRLGVAIIDILTGLFAANAVQAALFARERSPEHAGTQIEVSLFESALAALINVGQSALLSGRDAPRYGNAHPNIVPYQLFAAADGWFALAAGNDRQFAALCAALMHPGWETDPRFSTNAARVAHRAELIPALGEVFSERPVAHWLAVCEAADIPVAAVETVLDALRSPQARALGIVRSISHPTAGTLSMVGSPLRYDGTLPPIRLPPPLLGEHTAEILAELEREG